MTVLPANFFPCPIEGQSVQGVPAMWILAMVAVHSEPWTWQWLVNLTAWSILKMAAKSSKCEGLYSRIVEDPAQIKGHKPIDVVKYAVGSWAHALAFLH